MLTGCPYGHALQNNNLHTRSYLAHMSDNDMELSVQSHNLLHRSNHPCHFRLFFGYHLLKSVFELQENLILYHTEDKNIKERKVLYTEEGKAYYHGNLYVPDDMEAFEL